MTQLKFNKLQYGKEYKMYHRGLAYPSEVYIGRLTYIDYDKGIAQMQVRLSKKITGSFGEPTSYKIGIHRSDIDFEKPTVSIYEEY